MLSYFRRKGSIYFFGKPKKICNLCGFDTFNTRVSVGCCLLYVVTKEYSEFISYSLNNQRPPAGGMRMAPGRDQGHLCWGPLIFKMPPAILLKPLPRKIDVKSMTLTDNSHLTTNNPQLTTTIQNIIRTLIVNYL